MPNVPNKWLEAISVLIELTQQGQLKWELESRMALAPRGIALGTVAYRAKYEESWFRLTNLGRQVTFGSPAEPQFKLEIIDDAGNPLFLVPESSGLQDLYQAIQYQLSGVEKVLESLLKEKGR
jgi:hypothetical protein